MSRAYRALRPLIYLLEPEQAHALTLALLRLGGGTSLGRWLLAAWFRPRRAGPAVQVFGLAFKNPLGMAAGYDKDGLGWRGLGSLGFGHVELGTVTPLPQPGNPKPRVFRLVAERGVINRMGFPGRGAQFLARRMRGPRPAGLVLGVNIGKNKATPNEDAARDYLSLLDTFAPLADYLAVNVSSPNTPGLRALQTRQALESILGPLDARRRELAGAGKRPLPLLVKLAPDLSEAELDAALEAIVDCGMDGVILTNTTLRREGLHSSLAGEAGGLSGAPLGEISLRLVKRAVRCLDGRLPVVASGGVMSAEDVQARLDAGAALVQLYTGLIYEGPGLVREILDAGLKRKS